MVCVCARTQAKGYCGNGCSSRCRSLYFDTRLNEKCRRRGGVEYYGTELNPNAGGLLVGPLARFGKILYGDSLKSLGMLDKKIDLFINDSDHSIDYEMAEYQTVKGKLSPCAVILGDNSHASEMLSRFSAETGRNFVFFSEEPKNHWYPGGGIGISWSKERRVKTK